MGFSLLFVLILERRHLRPSSSVRNFNIVREKENMENIQVNCKLYTNEGHFKKHGFTAAALLKKKHFLIQLLARFFL